MKQKILITGVSGFAGSHFVDFLLKRDELDIHGTYLTEESLAMLSEKERINLRKIDLQKKEEVFKLVDSIRPDFIVHLAALTSPGQSHNNPSETIINNTLVQLHILEAVRNLKLSDTRILIVSSAEIYGAVDAKDLPMDEDTPLHPTNPYAVSKITQDFLGLQYFLSYKLSIIRVRPFNHIGPKQAPYFAIPSFAKKIAEIEKGKSEAVIHVGNLETRRDFTDVRDMVEAYFLALTKGEAGEVYNIGAGVSYTMSEILQRLLSYTSIKIKVEKDSLLFRPFDTPELICDCRKFSALTLWKPKISIEQSLKETLEYFRNIV